MTKPGPHPWSTNDTYAAGGATGSNTKAVPLAAQREDGIYPGERFPPDFLNWQLNRGAIASRMLARLQAGNYQKVYADPTDYLAGDLMASSFQMDSPTDLFPYASLYYHNDPGSTNNILERYVMGGTSWASNSNPLFTSIGSGPRIDADGSLSSYHRVIAGSWTGATDQVVYNASVSGAFTSVTWTGGAPGHDWRCVACDRDNDEWCIVGYTGAGTPAELRSSTDGITFSVESGFTNSNGYDPNGIYYSNHPAGSLGPDDTGNPSWIVTSNGGSGYRSTDHVTWSSTSTITTGTVPDHRALAYSRPSRRWIALPAGSALGDVRYSDDNGANWYTFSGVLPSTGGDYRVAGDGYGTFVAIKEEAAVYPRVWVSVDEGETWSPTWMPDQAGYSPIGNTDGEIIEPCFVLSDVDGALGPMGYFLVGIYVDGTPETLNYRSLVI